MNDTLLIGFGNLGSSITQAFLNKKKKISILEKSKKTLSLLAKKKNGLISIYENVENINFNKYKYIMICVKPADLKKLTEKLHHLIKTKNIIISLVAGTKIPTLKKLMSSKLSIVRFMPNLSIKYGESITAVYSDNLSAKEKKNIEKFSFFGTLIWLKKEEEINFFTAFFGGGPAYFCYFFQCLQNILEKKKINKQKARELTIQLLKSTVNFIEKEKIGFNDLIKMVASKNGTTEKALMHFSQNQKLESLTTSAIKKAENRSKQLSNY